MNMVVVLQVATTKATKEDQSMVLALTHKAPDPGCTPSCNQGTSFNSSNYVWSILFEHHLNPLNVRRKTSVSVITCNGEKKHTGVIWTTGRTKTIQMSFFGWLLLKLCCFTFFLINEPYFTPEPQTFYQNGGHMWAMKAISVCLPVWSYGEKKLHKIYESQLPLTVLELEHI